eukprot:3561399-Amphidinium_carterae.4
MDSNTVSVVVQDPRIQRMDARTASLAGGAHTVGTFVLFNIWWTFPAVMAAQRSRNEHFCLALQSAMVMRAQKELRSAAQQRTRDWRSWLEQADRKGGKAIHQWLKADCYTEVDIKAGEQVVLGDAAVHLLHDKWRHFWHVDDLPPWHVVVEDDLSPITYDEVLCASQSMSYCKGTGCDGFVAAWLQWLPADMLMWLTDLLNAYERLPGDQPSTMRTMIALIPKPNDRTGMQRPIALTGLLMRLYAKIRSRQVKGWLTTVLRSEHVGDSSLTCEHAGLQLAVHQAAARMLKQDQVLISLDLEKAAEGI